MQSILCCIFVCLVVANALLSPPITRIRPIKKGQFSFLAPRPASNDLAVTALPRVSLDKTIIPNTSSLEILAASGISMLLVAFIYCMLKSLATRRFPVPGLREHGSAAISAPDSLGATFDTRIQAMVDAAKLFFHRIRRLLPLKSAPVNNHAKPILTVDKWAVGVLEKIEDVDKEWLLYRFRVGDAHEGSAVRLDIGEQVILCLADSRGCSVKKSFYPVTRAPARSCVDVLVRRPSASHSTPRQFDFDTALRSLTIGDEVAMKKGSRRVQLPNVDATISQLVLLASGDGVLPALQLLRAMAGDPDTAVEQIDLLWINDSKRDFALNHEIEKLQHQLLTKSSGPRLRVARIVDRELGNPDTLLNEELLRALPEHRAGAAGLVFAEGTAAAKCRELLSAKGYSDACISGPVDPQPHS